MTAAATVLLSIWFAAAPPEEAGPAVKRLFRDFDYQQDLFPPPWRFEPSSGRPPAPEDSGEAKEPRHARGERWSRDGWREEDKQDIERHFGLPDERGWPELREREREMEPQSGGGFAGLASLLEILVWIGLAVLLGVVVSTLVQNRAVRREAPLREVQAGGAPAAALEQPRTAAEALAAEGRYEEAVHLLLLETIDALVAAQPGGVPEAWTSREIQRGLSMPEEARGPFAMLVDTVEASLFGGRPVAASDWEACRERFQTFASAYRGGRP